MLVSNALENTDSQKPDGEWPWMTKKVRYSPYGPWRPGYYFKIRNTSNMVAPLAAINIPQAFHHFAKQGTQ